MFVLSQILFTFRGIGRWCKVSKRKIDEADFID